MKTSEYRSIAEALNKFANPREKATGPESMIGVQNKDGVLKLISGNSRSGIVVKVNDFISSGDCTFAFSARPFLQGAKVLPAKSEVTVQVSPEGLSVVTEGGGRIDLRNELPLREVGFAKRPSNFRASCAVPVAEWKRISKMFKSISAKVEVPSIQLVGDAAYATAVAPGNRSRYANLKMVGRGDDGYNMSAYLDFWEGLTAITEDGIMTWGKAGVVATGGDVTCFSAPYLVSRYVDGESQAPEETKAWPILAVEEPFDNSVTIPRRTLIDVVKGQAPFDEHNRVTLEVDTDSLRITPFGGDTGQTVTAQANGKGIRSVSAEYLNGLLSNMDSKEVTLRWGAGQPAVSITSGDYADWTILLAPVSI